MNCNNIKELILTDYVDNELAPDKRTLLETHLMNCPACRNLASSIKETAGILADGKRVSLDRDKIWQKITAEIASEKSPSIIYEPRRQMSLLEKIFPVARPAVVGVGLVLLIVLTTFYFKPVNTAKLQEQEEGIEYLAYTVDAIDTIDDVESDGFGTSIEEYFL